VLRRFGRFSAADEIEADGFRIKARWIVIAAGSAPVVPEIPGLAQVPFLTNESLFQNEALPAHLIVLGGGPVGIEMAQAHRRLGAQVTVVEALPQILAHADPELAALLARRLRREGIALRTGVAVEAVAGESGGIALALAGGERLLGSHLLVAAGRRPALAQLALEKAGIARDAKGGLLLDRRLRTSNRRVFAVGDAAGGPQFTHVANYQAGIVLRNLAFRLPAKVDYRALPSVTYTDPELAEVGLSESAAAERFGDEVRILRAPVHESDRAQTERQTGGLIKAIVRRNGRILGAAILAPEAGELIQPWVLAIGQRLKIGAFAQMIAPYPTLGEIGKRAAGRFYLPRLFSERSKRVVRWLQRFPVG